VPLLPEDKFPYRNLQPENLQGERWRPIAGFEGYYDISSFGRIKSLARERVLHHGGIQPIKARILRLRLVTQRNKTVQENLQTLIACLSLEGIKYFYSVGRLVYNAFVAAFDLDNKDVRISYKDGCSLNLHYKNLIATNISALRQKSYENGRYMSHLRKPVSQFTVDGTLVAQYSSMYEAGRINGIDERAIAGAAANDHNIVYKGFVWQAGHSKKLKKDKLIARNQPTVNTSLQLKRSEKKDGIPAVINLQLTKLEGERWKDFPGYEGLYKVSNFGRVKSLARISDGKQQHWCPERIKQLTAADKNKVAPGKRTTLIVTLSKDRRKRTYSVARYVYYLFVKAFQIDDPSLRVYYKDGNPYNLHYSNLMLRGAVWSIRNSAD
jgi:hypothetical protein